ncbi:hypothetical protein [Porphyromonas gingivicanis]|uniref:hypothetical protein n=1 Tax=Porphyromonas gingivicanis TaxID=266762 RepID=UPI00047157D8|nr:hypothetical protein [Porphyromonas gingivicanis]
MKHLLHTLFLSAFALPMGNLCVAQEQVVPPTPFFHTSFETWSKNDLNEEIINIEGYRWKLCNATIAENKLKRIPSGQKALELVAGSLNGIPTTFELLDNIPASQISFVLATSGMDGVISKDNTAWIYELSYDDGKTWQKANSALFTLDLFPSVITIEAPDMDNRPFRFRIRYQSQDERRLGSGFRILIDDLCFYPYETGVDAAWDIRPEGIVNGYETTQTRLEVKPQISGASWILWGSTPEPYYSSTTYMTVTLDNDQKVDIKHLNDEIEGHSAIFDNLSEGKHSLELQFVDITSNKPYPGIASYKMDFWVRPYKKIQSLKELKKGNVGEFYEITPEKDDLYLNFSIPLCNQHWLIQGEAGIMLNDPLYYLPIAKDLPLKKKAVQSIRGQLVRQDNNLAFVLDTTPKIKETEADWSLINFTCKEFKELAPIKEQLHGLCLSLQAVYISEAISNTTTPFIPAPNRRFSFKDKNGDLLAAQNIYPHLFLRNKTIPQSRLTVFGFMGKDFASGEMVIFPILAKENPLDDAVQPILNSELIQLAYTGEGIELTAQKKCQVHLFSLDGNTIREQRIEPHTPTSIVLPAQSYILIAYDEEEGNYVTHKIIL